MNALSDENLSKIAADLSSGIAPPPETVRNILRWFDASRRGYRVVAQIKRALGKHGVATDPDLEYQYIDATVRFVRAKPNADGADTSRDGAATDPTYRLARLEAANKRPVAIAPTAALQQAVTLMMANDFSQLPVMTGPRDLKGVVSWKSIGSRLALGRPCSLVKDCMASTRILQPDDSLFTALEVIRLQDYVLVQAQDKTICGIVTASDVNAQFRLLAEPFLLAQEIEHGIRRLLQGKFTAKELEAAKAPGDARTIEGITDLTLGEYIRLIEAEDRWKKLGIPVDRQEFVGRLNGVREIRNDVMHFDPDGLDPGDMVALREFASFLRQLREVGIG